MGKNFSIKELGIIKKSLLSSVLGFKLSPMLERNREAIDDRIKLLEKVNKMINEKGREINKGVWTNNGSDR